MPDESKISIKIDYAADDSSAARVFEIAADLIKAFEDLDRVLITSIDSRILSTFLLEDVSKSSLLVRLRSFLVNLDDQALKELNWRKQVGIYLVRAKYLVLEWLDRKIEEGEVADLSTLARKISALAAQTNVRHLPDYPPPNLTRLAQPLDALQRAKRKFRRGEQLLITLDKSEYRVDLNETWLPSERLPDSLPEQQLLNEADLILVIKKADFLARSQWQFRLGKTSISAIIEDNDWMDAFHRGEHALKPGDALRVRVRFERKYDSAGELIEEKQAVIKVYGIVHPLAPPQELFDG